MLVLSGQEQGRPHSCICKIRIALLRCLRCLSRWGFSPAGQLLGWSDLEGPPSAFLTISFPLYHPFLYPFDTRKKRVGRAVIRTGTQKRKKKKNHLCSERGEGIKPPSLLIQHFIESHFIECPSVTPTWWGMQVGSTVAQRTGSDTWFCPSPSVILMKYLEIQ